MNVGVKHVEVALDAAAVEKKEEACFDSQMCCGLPMRCWCDGYDRYSAWEPHREHMMVVEDSNYYQTFVSDVLDMKELQLEDSMLAEEKTGSNWTGKGHASKMDQRYAKRGVEDADDPYCYRAWEFADSRIEMYDDSKVFQLCAQPPCSTLLISSGIHPSCCRIEMKSF